MLLIAGVGYSHLSDLSFGPMLIEDLQDRDWPDRVQIEDLSYGPIAVLQWFQDEPGKFDQAIFVGAMQRENGVPGEIRSYHWNPGELDPKDVHERVTEAVTGIVSLENLLMIMDYFGVLPGRSLVIEIEPADIEFGLELSPSGKRRLAEVRKVIEREVLEFHSNAYSPAGRLHIPQMNGQTGLNGGSRNL
jgi:hydrogenase maturation protease